MKLFWIYTTATNLDQITFSNNSGNGRLLEPVRGNTGSVAIGYNLLPAKFTHPTLTVSNCIFRNNKALGFLSPERAVIGQVFLGRGGAMALYMNESYHDIRVEIMDSVFENNKARLFGGGLHFLTTSYMTVQHMVRVERTRFSGNVGVSGGGGVQFSTLSAGDVNRPHNFTFSDCVFERNRGQSGGGIYIFLGIRFKIYFRLYWSTSLTSIQMLMEIKFIFKGATSRTTVALGHRMTLEQQLPTPI